MLSELLSLLSSLTVSEDDWESTNKPPLILETMQPLQLPGEGTKKPPPPMLASLLLFAVSLSVWFLLLLSSFSVLSLLTSLITESHS